MIVIDNSDDEGETCPKVTIKPLSEDDLKVLDYYMNSKKAERQESAVNMPLLTEKSFPKRVSTKRPFKVRGFHMHKKGVKTYVDYTCDFVLEPNDI